MYGETEKILPELSSNSPVLYPCIEKAWHRRLMDLVRRLIARTDIHLNSWIVAFSNWRRFCGAGCFTRPLNSSNKCWPRFISRDRKGHANKLTHLGNSASDEKQETPMSSHCWCKGFHNIYWLSSNIPSAPAHGVYVSQLISYARACSNYQDFMERGKVLTTKLLSQGYQKSKLVATLKKFYGRHHDLVNPYNVVVSRIVSDVFANDAP